MKSYSDAVPDTNKVQEVESKLTLALVEQDKQFALTLANMKAEQDKVNKANDRTHMLTIFILIAMSIQDIVRYGFFG